MLTQDQRIAVIEEAKTWLNTPYHNYGRIKGAGVDCAMLLAEVYERAGVITHIEPGYYSPQFGVHRSEEVFQRFVEAHAQITLNPQPGDCVLYKFGRCFSHGAILITDTIIIHAVVQPGFVCYGDLDEADLINRKKHFFTVR